MGLPFFPCGECGKVCKSTRGLSQHSFIHRQPGELRNPIRGFYREHHPLLNGFFFLLFHPSLCSQFLKGHRAIIVEIFSHQTRRQHHHRPSQTAIGPRSHRGKDSSSPKFYTSRHISRKALSTNFSTSGVPHSSPTTTFPPSLVTRISMHRLTRSNWEISHGDHTPPTISGSVLKTARYQSG